MRLMLDTRRRTSQKREGKQKLLSQAGKGRDSYLPKTTSHGPPGEVPLIDRTVCDFCDAGLPPFPRQVRAVQWQPRLCLGIETRQLVYHPGSVFTSKTIGTASKSSSNVT
jgi:hypothetical protein